MTNALRLSELTTLIQGAIDAAFGAKEYWVIGEISGHGYKAAKNYHYFELIEKNDANGHLLAKLICGAWGFGATRIGMFEGSTGQKFTDGISVLVKVKMTYHPLHGLKANILEVDYSYTIGLMALQREDTLRRLEIQCSTFIQKQGDAYITRNNQLRMPLVLQNIAVISAKNSAGYQDFIHTIEKNKFGYRIAITPYFSSVQGESNEQEIIDRLIQIHEHKVQFDAVFIIRGGGAQTDLLVFDQFKLARAVAKFPIPIVTGIGHQRNESICDLMAHTATKTPTMAAEFIIAINRSFEDSLFVFQKSLIIKSQQMLAKATSQLSEKKDIIVNNSTSQIASNTQRLSFTRNQVIVNSHNLLSASGKQLSLTISNLLVMPQKILNNRSNELSKAKDYVTAFSRNILKNQRGYLGHFEAVMKLVAPQNLLKRGFAYVKVNEQIVANAKNIGVGKSFKVVMQDAEIGGMVISKNQISKDGSDV
jgi:exodeoxyribonuclease VII large subunit